ASDAHVSRERRGARSAPRAGAGEGSDSAVMKRREFISSVGRTVGLSVGPGFLGLRPTVRLSVSPTLLIPMDDAQSDHLKAYGVAYRAIQAGLKAEWLLNYRGGSFLLPDGPALRREAALAGVGVEPVDDARVTAIRGEIEGANADAVPLEKAPRVAERVAIAASYADGTPPDPQADAKLDWSQALAFTGGHVEPDPTVASFSDIDGHQVNAPGRRQPLGAFKLFNFSAKIDPVPAMLVQNHRQVIPDFYGLTTSFVRERLKPGDTVLGDEEGAP